MVIDGFTRLNRNDEVERYKAMLVSKGYNQREDVDYGKTFSLVVKMVTIGVVSLIVNNEWGLFQLDV